MPEAYRSYRHRRRRNGGSRLGGYLVVLALLLLAYWYFKMRPEPAAPPTSTAAPAPARRMTDAMTALCRELTTPLDNTLPNRTKEINEWITTCNQFIATRSPEAEAARHCRRLCQELLLLHERRHSLTVLLRQHERYQFGDVTASMSREQKRDFFMADDRRTWDFHVRQARPLLHSYLQRLAAAEARLQAASPPASASRSY